MVPGTGWGDFWEEEMGEGEGEGGFMCFVWMGILVRRWIGGGFCWGVGGLVEGRLALRWRGGPGGGGGGGWRGWVNN